MSKLLNKLFQKRRPANFFDACLPLSHDAQLWQHRERQHCIQQQMRRHQERFTP